MRDVILLVIPPGATLAQGAYWLDGPPDLSCQDTTGQYVVDDPLLSCNQL